MRIENNGQLISNGLKFSIETNVDKVLKTDPFSKFFDQAVNLLEDTNIIQKDVEQKQLDFITGKSDDMIALSMAQSRASSAIQFTSQVTNKILTAYQEIMRIAI
ncbi:MAG: flagellar hook-basal body complex protein FliE [Clostridiales bacterium]|nr:flagellar hook-basal body complex protein FliE [Clostridiales bacterium]